MSNNLVGKLVFFEDQGTPSLGLVQSEQKGKLEVVNYKNKKERLGSNRLILINSDSSLAPEKLEGLFKQCSEKAQTIDLKSLWEGIKSKQSIYTHADLAKTYFSNPSYLEQIAMRMALIIDKLYFKRKDFDFIPRDEENVSELKVAREKELKREVARKNFLEAVQKSINQKTSIDTSKFCDLVWQIIYNLKLLASCSIKMEVARKKEALATLQELHKRDLLTATSKQPEKQAYQLLLATGLIDKNEDLIFFRHHIKAEYTEKEVEEANNIISSNKHLDLTHLQALTIDSESTKDCDDAFTIEQLDRGYSLGIHISNVAELILPDSALDQAAKKRVTSLYSTEAEYHMLPPILATDKLSLNSGKIRNVVSCLLEISQDFEIKNKEFKLATIKTNKNWSYGAVDEALEHQSDQTLNVLSQIAASYEARRIANGAIKIPRGEAEVKLINTELKLETSFEDSPARNLVGELMVLYNESVGEFFYKNGIPAIFRSQEVSKQEQPQETKELSSVAVEYLQRSQLKPSSTSLIAKRHASLAVDYYCQVSSPIRRYHDLLCQRQLTAFLQNGQSYYNKIELQKLLEDTENLLKIKTIAAREKKRFWLLRYLEEHKDQQLWEATVLRNDGRKALVEIHELFMPTLASISRNFKVGDKIKLKIISVAPVFDELIASVE